MESGALSEPVGVEGGCVEARIKALDAVTSSNIRKGQIVSKVSDIVRELVENSLDAGASAIQVYLEKFGADKIEVRDNGHGIRQADMDRIFKGGSTSKLQSKSNLSRGTFLGFRGEALSAICAAGTVTVISRCTDESIGTCYKLDYLGNIIQSTKQAAKVGTAICVEKLFQHIRVRRQRIEDAKTGASEIKEIEGYLKGVGIIHNKCHLSFFHNTSSIWTKASVQSVEQALYAVLGHNIARKLRKCGPVRVEQDEDCHTVEGSLPSQRSIEMYFPIKPVDMRTMSFTSNKMAMIFCNRKRVYIRELEKLIHSYVVENVTKSIPSDQRRFPVSVVSIEVPPSEADFNLDMDKAKVLLVQKDKILSLVEEELVKFYGKDLRKPKDPEITETSARRDKFNADESISSIEMEESFNAEILPERLAFEQRNTKKVAPLPTTKRQTTISSFLENIPSRSDAFEKSPVKPLDSQPTSVMFPHSKPTVDVPVSNPSRTPKPGGGKIVSNFHISIDSQELSMDPNSLEDALPEELNQHQANAPVRDETAPDVPVENLTDWLEGRMIDKYGDTVQAVEVVRSNPSKTTSISDENSWTNHQLERSLHTSRSPMEPPAKRLRHDGNAILPPALSPVIPFATPNPPRMATPRQITIDSMVNWSHSGSTHFGQATSKPIAGVRIPYTPKKPNCDVSASSPLVPKGVPPPVLHWEGKQRDQSGFIQSPVTSLQSTGLFFKTSPQHVHETRRRLHPCVHKTLLGGNHLYAVQTDDSIGVFHPLNMLKIFPQEASDCCVVHENSEPELSFENVAKLFRRFLAIPNVNQHPHAGHVFHSLRKLPDIM